MSRLTCAADCPDPSRFGSVQACAAQACTACGAGSGGLTEWRDCHSAGIDVQILPGAVLIDRWWILLALVCWSRRARSAGAGLTVHTRADPLLPAGEFDPHRTENCGGVPITFGAGRGVPVMVDSANGCTPVCPLVA